jgi:hypothetical protein
MKSRKIVALAGVVFAVGAFLAVPGATANAATAQPNAYSCKTTKHPPKDPWYLCIDLGTTNNAAWQAAHPGCFPTYTTVCHQL